MTQLDNRPTRDGRPAGQPWAMTALPRLESRLDRGSPEFQANAAAMRGQVELLRERHAVVQQGGGEEAMRRHRARGKLPARERVDRLLDPGSSFLEFSPL